MSGFESNIQSLIKLINEHDNALKDIQVKLKDFNIIELFKSIGDNSENGNNTNIFSNLIDNLDKNVNEKIKIIEEKMSKND